MEVKITEKGVYDQDGKPVPVGTTITVKGDAMPAYLVSKAMPVEEPKKRVAVTNPKKGAVTEEQTDDGA